MSNPLLKKLQLLKKKDTLIVNEEIEVTSSLNEMELNKEQIVQKEADLEPKSFFNIPSSLKDNKEITDLFIAVEQITLQRQLSDHNINELQNRLTHTKDQLNEEIKEVRRINIAVENKDIKIKDLETKITEKNLMFDQLMEDFSNIKNQLSEEISELKNLNSIEHKKYKALNEQYENEVFEWVNKVKRKEDRILDLETENENLKEQNEKITKENKYLLTMANDFTNRMAASFLEHKGGEKE